MKPLQPTSLTLAPSGLMRLAMVVVLSTTVGFIQAATCTFTGNGDGTSWTDGSNWSCGSEPDPSNDNVIIPSGFSVVNDGESDFAFGNNKDFTINGSLDMNGKKIELTHSNNDLLISSTGSLTDCKELFITSNSDAIIESGASVTVEHLKVDDNSDLTINASCINVTDKLENLAQGTIDGTGCINYSGSSGNFVNSGSGGIFGCTSNTLSDCSLSGGGALPIELISFDAVPEEFGVELEWVTATEINNDFFQLERSTDLETWETVGEVDGAGNSNAMLTYTFVDDQPLKGLSYYRMMQRDFNGDYSYSPIRMVEMEDNRISKITAYPNPTNDQLTVSADGGNLSDLRIFNLVGQEMSGAVAMVNQSPNQRILNLSNLPSGAYFLQSGETTVKVIKR